MKNLFLSLVLMTLPIIATSQTTITLQPNAAAGKDASLGSHTNFNTENTNYGTNQYFSAYCIPGSSGGQNTNRAIIDFDLTTIPAGATIVSANLTLYSTGYINALLPGHFGNNASTLQRITSSWSESSVTWNSAPTTTAVNQVSMPQSSNSSQNYTSDVSAMLQDMINNPSSSFGFYYAMVTENPSNSAGLLFWSSDCSDSTKWPKLEITYTGGNCMQPDPNAGNDASLGSHTNFNTENSNYGTNQYFNAYCIPGSSGGQNTNRALIKFDLSSIPAAATVISADLYLYGTGYINSLLPGHFGNNTSTLERNTSAWSENTVTWNSAPTTTSAGSANIPQSTTAAQDYIINVTTMAQYQVANPTLNYGYSFRLVTENPSSAAGLLFWSSDCSNPLQRPQLCITYSDSLNPKGIQVYISPEVQVVVFPNPAAEHLTIACAEEISNATVNIYDVEGRIVKQELYSTRSNTFVISVAELSTGTYTIEIIGDEKKGTSTFVRSE